MRWTDDHCHLPDDLAAAAEAIADAATAGVERIITVGTEVRHSRAAIAVARAFDGVWATAGVHPHEAKDGIELPIPCLGRVPFDPALAFACDRGVAFSALPETAATRALTAVAGRLVESLEPAR